MATNTSGPTNRLYLLRPNIDRDLYCGRTLDGRQFLLGPKDDSTVCIVFFDREGNYLNWQERAVPPGALCPAPPPAESESYGQWANEIQRHYENTVSSIDGRVEPIHVHSFAVPDTNFSMSISDLPCYLQQLVDHPEEEKRQVGRSEFDRLTSLLVEWIERGDYVLTWGDAFHVNKDGEILFS